MSFWGANNFTVVRELFKKNVWNFESRIRQNWGLCEIFASYQVPTNDSNVEIVASDVANLTSNSSDLTVEDVVYTSMVLENIASISSITEQVC